MGFLPNPKDIGKSLLESVRGVGAGGATGINSQVGASLEFPATTILYVPPVKNLTRIITGIDVEVHAIMKEPPDDPSDACLVLSDDKLINNIEVELGGDFFEKLGFSLYVHPLCLIGSESVPQWLYTVNNIHTQRANPGLYRTMPTGSHLEIIWKTTGPLSELNLLYRASASVRWMSLPSTG